ncbi:MULTISPECIES: class I SAM-dependent methyltransferase [Rossellomorea]|uniref:class I SAM-dependent methyltransferase n=2 Tax=Bacillaceae TaxID=186817 RepID=UPI001CCCB1EC|nr:MULTISPECIES: class I SAM-dependent methyltransferase [Rossellomorea]MCA0151022.1 class I SAM-dependent methyltransferase [Rossellomorea vietnamensis]UTE76876.1 class I SAM-dependent methyltransferase [Rossellomorea sp. KS-H15a]WGG44794.1 class I SAM-dependent methyltransferase [Rossellomorea sp. DA94]
MPMINSPVESLFGIIDETATLLKDELACSYLEAVAETGENLFQGDVLQEEVSELTKKRLNKKYDEANVSQLENENIRKAFQFAILKGMKENVQPNHQMTPDSLGLFISYLVNKFTAGMNKLTVLDPAIGTGNLLTTVLNQMPGKETQSIGVEIDEVLIKLAYVGADLQKHPLQLFNQDSLEPLFIDPVDLVLCDLPIGYYPNDLRAQDYELKAEEGHSYAHHLFIEQSLKHTKDGGYLFFIVPNGLFESPHSAQLQGYLKEKADIQGFLQLPLSLFKNKNSAKSILILQKKKEGIKPPKEVLLAQLPSLSNQRALQDILSKIDQWLVQNK